MLVCVEGLDKMGKSTLVKALMEELPEALYTKEPGSLHVPQNPDLREMVLKDSSLTCIERELLFYVDASKHRKFIQNNRDKLIISDRGLWSHLAYLTGYLKTNQIDYDQYNLLNKLIKQCCAIPEIIFYVKGSLELMKERQNTDSKDVIESNSDAFYAAVKEKYDDLSKETLNIGPKIYTIDATTPIALNVKTMLILIKLRRIENAWKEGNK